jgi:opacity protein-like surface antigen
MVLRIYFILAAVYFSAGFAAAAESAPQIYVSAGYSRNWQSMNLPGETWSYGGGEAGIINPESGRVIVSPGKNFTHDAPGGAQTNASNRAALALGIDLKSRFNLPFRFEMEGTFQDVAYVNYGSVYGEYGSGNDTEIPRTENFGAQQSLQMKYFSLMLNGYFDLHNRTPFVPYVGVGVGSMHYSAKLTTEISIEYKEQLTTPGLNIGFADRPEQFEKSIDGWLFSMGLTAGVSYKFSPAVVVDLAYRYTYIDDISFEPSANGPYSDKIPLILETSGQTLSLGSNQLILGMRFILW